MKEKKLFLWLFAFEILFSLGVWFKVSFTDPIILEDITMPIFMILESVIFLIFILSIKATYRVGFKPGITGFYLGLTFLLFFHLSTLGVSSSDELFYAYFTFPLGFLLLFPPLWIFISFIIKISK